MPSVTVGTVEPRTVVESIRTLYPWVKFVEAEVNPSHSFEAMSRPSYVYDGMRFFWLPARACAPKHSREKSQCTGMDHKAKTLALAASKEVSSSRVVKDSARVRPAFSMAYDKLVSVLSRHRNVYYILGSACVGPFVACKRSHRATAFNLMVKINKLTRYHHDMFHVP